MDRFGDKICCNPTVKLKKQESYPVIDIDKITPGYKAVRSVASIEYTGQGGAKFQAHDVLFARITPCLENGKMAIADTEGQNGIGSTELFVFRGIDGVSDTDYIYYLLCMKHIRQLAANSMTGASGRQRADLDFIKRIQWDFPDIEMQKKIASVLSAYDNLIEVNNKRVKVLELMAENLYKEWFVRFRFPGHETSGFENGIPKGWNVCRFSSIANVLSGGTPSTDHDEYYGGNIPFYTPKDSSDDYFVFDTISKLTEEGLQHCNSQLYPKNTIMITARGTVGNLNLLAKPMAMNQSCYALTSNTIPSQYFLFFLIKREILKLRKVASGGVFDTIIVSTFDHIKVTIPDKSLIMSFDMLVSPILDETYTLLKQNRNLIRQRDLLLPRLMSGKLEV